MAYHWKEGKPSFLAQPPAPLKGSYISWKWLSKSPWGGEHSSPPPHLNGGGMEEKGGLWWEKVSSQNSSVIFLNGTYTGEPPARLKRRFQDIFKLQKWWE